MSLGSGRPTMDTVRPRKISDHNGYVEIFPVDDEEEVECEAEEGLRPQRVKNPMEPSRQEWEEHCITHLPYRSWCPHCVRGRGINSPHRATSREDPGIPLDRWNTGS